MLTFFPEISGRNHLQLEGYCWVYHMFNHVQRLEDIISKKRGWEPWLMLETQRNIPQTSNGLLCIFFSFTKVMPGFCSHPESIFSMCGFSMRAS